MGRRMLMERPGYKSEGESLSVECDWLQRIALQRDEAAFGLLYKAYQKRGYNLARGILGDGRQAEDAFQDGMFRIWRMAGSFKPDGNPRGWILQTIARASLARLRKSKKIKEIGVDQQELGVNPGRPSDPGEQLIEREVQSALRRKWEQLNPSDRSLLALYYGGDLSQDEIASKLGVPQRTISDRIRKTLEVLRKALGSSAVAAAAPLAFEECLRSTIFLGDGPSTQISAKILETIREDAASVTTEEGTLQPSGSFVKGRVALFTCLAVGLGLVGGLAMLTSPTGSLEPVPETLDSDESEPMQIVDESKPLNRAWSFNVSGDQLRDLRVLRGNWRWLPKGGADGLGCMETTTKVCAVAIEVPIRRLPVYVSYLVRPIRPFPNGGFYSGMIWSDYLEWAHIRNYGRPKTVAEGDWIERVIRVEDHFISTWAVPAKFNTVEYITRKPRALLVMMFRGCHQLDGLKLIEQRQRGPSKEFGPILNAIQKIEPSNREGAIVAPQLKSVFPPKPVVIEFGKPEPLIPLAE